MKRVVVGFLLFLFVFLSDGYTQLYAHNMEGNINHVASQFTKHSLPGTDRIQHVVDVTIEQEDDDNTSSKKYIDNSAVYIQTYSNNSSAERLPINRSFVDNSSSRSYILFRVFRV